ncbi:MAG TPA: GtrA family protein [Magnetospirillaceae bacterium]|nr:GtrA family protein [Magnetospirillaceae bacterium]
MTSEGKLKARVRTVLKGRTDRTIVQFIRYGMVAVVALAFDFGTYAFLVRIADVHPVVAATIGFTLGLFVNYLLSILWVFNQRTRSKRIEMMTFMVIGLIGLGLTDILIWLMAIEWHVDDLLAKLVATGIVFFWNFGARKILLFKVKPHVAKTETDEPQ